MNRNYDDEFFDDLDKTTDLLKAFKPHIDTDDKVESLDDLYHSFNSGGKSGEKNNINNINDNQFDLNEPIYQQEKDSIDMFSNDSERLSNNEQIMSKFASLEEKREEKLDLNEIIEEMHESVEKEKKKKKEKLDKIKKKKENKENSDERDKNKIEFKFGEKVFIIVSLIFIVISGVIYGTKMMKNKGSKNETADLIATSIEKNSHVVNTGDGLYKVEDGYIYKGVNINNYVLFSNMKWRIIKKYEDGSMDMILDDAINSSVWNINFTTYDKSDIHTYLNEYFLEYLDKKYLIKTSICMDEVNTADKFSCSKTNDDSYVRLPSIQEYLNSKSTLSYMIDSNSAMWFNTVSADKVWFVNGGKLAVTNPAYTLAVKPVVRLKGDVKSLGGNGSETKPYIVNESDKLEVGDYVLLDKDKYIVYDLDTEKVNLVLDNVLPNNYIYSAKSNIYDLNDSKSLAYYLNNYYYNSLSYKDLLLEYDWNTGVYQNSYKDTLKSKVRAKIGLYSLVDLKFNNNISGYFISNGFANKIYLYGNKMTLVEPSTLHSIRPTICIKNESITSGNGTIDNPYILKK